MSYHVIFKIDQSERRPIIVPELVDGAIVKHKMDALVKLECQLELEIQTYKDQLEAVVCRLEEQGEDGVDSGSLLELKNTLQELITVSEERLFDAKKQKLLLAFTGEQRELAQTPVDGAEEPRVELVAPPPSVAVVRYSSGDKCCVRVEESWGAVNVLNAMVLSVPEDSNMALVLLLNPLYDKMKPCPFFLNGKCRFEVDDCSYSHGHLVAQSDILPYREPDHASLGVGAVCLAQDEDSGLWKRAQVTSVDATGVGVTFDEQRREAVLEYSSVLPLEGDSSDRDSDRSDNGENSDSNDGDGDVNSGSECDDNDEDVKPEVVVIASHHSDGIAPQFAEWERHTKGIGSKLMARMGYVPGQGLGTGRSGRVEPVEIVILPPGLSLDACVELRERGQLKRVDDSCAKASKGGAKMRGRRGRGSELESAGQEQDVFTFLNSAILRKESSAHSHPPGVEAAAGSHGLHRQLFQVQEDVKVAEQRVVKLRESLQRNKQNSGLEVQIKEKLLSAEREVGRLHNLEQRLNSKLHQRRQKTKLTVF